MKRELKFRVWNGAEMVYDVTVGKFGVFYVNPSNNGLDPNDSASLTPFTTKYHDDTPVMQYTGLKDKNGKEIYEGDIVQDSAMTYTIAFGSPNNDNDCYGWYLKHDISSKSGSIYEGDQDVIEVIGNIYENPKP